MSDTNVPQILTLEALTKFKEDLVKSIGINLGHNNSIVLAANKDVQKVANSAIIGENHTIELITLNTEDSNLNFNKQSLKNVLIAGQSNIATSWNQTIIGSFNKPVSDAAFLVGTGTSELTRNNAFEIYKDGRVGIHDVFFTPVNSDQLGITGKLSYNNGGLLKDVQTDHHGELSWEGIQSILNNLNGNELITADILQALFTKISCYLSFDAKEADNWRNNLVQGLDYSADDLASKALSVEAGLKLKEEFGEAKITELKNAIFALKSQISYLISCLTVDKITNADTKADTDELVEYYAVGIADYALDSDTVFSFHPNVSNEEEDK
jgi:hypothetical protein